MLILLMKSIDPDLGLIFLDNKFNKVVFPAPFLPTRPILSPGFI